VTREKEEERGRETRTEKYNY